MSPEMLRIYRRSLLDQFDTYWSDTRYLNDEELVQLLDDVIERAQELRATVAERHQQDGDDKES